MESGDENPYDIRGIRKDGSVYELEVHAKLIPYKGKMLRIAELRDITERKKAAEKILEQNARLLAITDDLKFKNEQLDDFTQIVSHNLRSPAGNIVSLTRFLQDPKFEGDQQEILTLLKDSGDIILGTLSELNEVLKIKQNKNVEKQELEFEKVLDKVKQMMNAHIAETRASIDFDFSQARAISYPNIYMESILLNLLSNALKYKHPERQPHVKFITRNTNGSVILEVSDNGLGINLDRYGHQVFKLRKTFHQHPDGRGIGLFMIKNQIEAMGGKIKVNSVEGEGSTFVITF
jgi:signal transduction histidine kinase